MNTADVYPVLLALLGSALFGTSNLVARYALRHAAPRFGSLLSIGATAAFYWLLFPFFPGEVPWGTEMLPGFVLVFAVIGLVSPSVTLFLAFEGNRRMGATVSGTLASTAPLWAAGSAIVVLGEHLTPAVAVGVAGIVAGVMVFTWQGAGRRDWPLWAALFPLGAAALRGGVQMGSKVGFAYAEAPFTAGLITFTVSLVCVALAYRLSGLRVPARPFAGGMRWFLVTGVLNGSAMLCMLSALAVGRVVVVSPVISTYPLFTFFLAWAARAETLGWRIFVGVTLAVAGVVLITLR